MSALVLAAYIALLAWGGQIIGYDDPHGRIQLALLATFVMGAVVGYRGRG
ncbi:hypothetical protein [Sphingobium aquiterrae]